MNADLEKIGLSTLNYRLVSNLLWFMSKMASVPSAPKILREQLIQTRLNNNLRSKGKIVFIPDRSFNKFGDMIFQFYSTKIINNISSTNF